LKTLLLRAILVCTALLTCITTVNAQRYTSDTYGYACYNYFDNTNVTTTVSGTSTTSTNSSYSFVPDPTIAANNTSVVVSSAANLSVTTPVGAGLQSKYQATPKGIAINNIATADAATFAPLNSNDWEWSFIYKSNLTGTTYPTSAPVNAAITSNTANSWRYWIHSTTTTTSAATQGFYITQSSDGCLYVYVQSGTGTTKQLLKYATPLTNGVAYCIKIQRLVGAYWNLYVDPYTSSVTQAQTLRASFNNDAQTIPLTYSNSVIEAENVSGNDGLFQFDEMHMYTRYCQFTGITNTANGITPVPYYGGEGTVIVYGEQIQMRGNYALGGQIYIGKNDSGNPEANVVSNKKIDATLYLTTDSVFSTTSPNTSISSSTLTFTGGGVSSSSSSAAAQDVNDSFTSSGNPDGSLTTTGYYFITTVIKTTVTNPTASFVFTGDMQVYDNAKNNSPINCVGLPPPTSTTVTFGNAFDWKGGTPTSGIYLWATGANWVGGTAPSNATDVARFGVYSTSYPYNQQPTLKTSVSIGAVIVSTNIKTSTGANTGGAATFNLTTGSAGTTLTLSGYLTINSGASLNLSGYSSTSQGNLNLTSASASTIAATGFLSATNTILTNKGSLTLYSNATGSATIGQLINSIVSGNVNVQRYITGGSSVYRGYRLLSSPVNIDSLTSLNSTSTSSFTFNSTSPATLNSTVGHIGLNYLNSGSGAISTAGPGGKSSGFSVTNANPLIYLYDESRISSNSSFVSGKNIGITAITDGGGSPAYSVSTLSGTTATSGVQIPVGNSFLLYYVGSNKSSVISSTRIPDAATATATGFINQGPVPVIFWNTKSTEIPYHTGTGANLPGLNQVGNPYPCTISLDQVAIDNPTISPQFWELDEPGGTYISYNTNGATSNIRASKYIVSGQGFLVQALGTGETITFQEDQKVAYPSGFTTSSSPGALLLSIPPSTSISNTDNAQSYASAPAQPTKALSGLHLQLSKDSTAYTQTGIYFSTKWSDAYSQIEDAIDLDGATPKVYLSSYSSDGKRLSINELGDYTQSKRIKLYAGATSSGLYTISLADIVNMDITDYNIFLIDRKMNDSLDMVRYKSYAFNINNSDTSTWGANRFVLAIEHAPVPQYMLTSFKGAIFAAGIRLTWQTLNAGDYTGYILQKQDAAGNYNPLYSIQSDKGETSYSYIDQTPIIGNNIYRLAQNGINGQITYSDPLTIKYNKAALTLSGLSLYPNPSNSVVNIIYTNRANPNPSPNYTIDIFNAAGTFIKHESINSNAWTENINAFKLGVYLLQLKDNTGNLVGQIKFIKNL